MSTIKISLMKYILSIIALSFISPFISIAQFNKSYTLSNYQFSPQTILSTSWDNVYSAALASSLTNPVYEIIARYDQGGTLIRSVRLTDYASYGAKIIEAEDKTLLFAVYSVAEGAVVIIKFDDNLNLVWSKKIQTDWKLTSLVDIVMQHNTGEPYYYIGYSDRTGDVNYPFDYSYCLAKLDRDGNYIWNNKYSLSNRNQYAFSVVEDKFNAMCSYMPTDDDPFRIALAGTREEVSTQFDLYTVGVLIVNEDGSVYDRYHRLSTSSNYQYKGPDILFDKSDFVIATTEYALNPQDTPAVSTIDLLKVKADFTSATSRYYHSDCENSATGVYKATNSNEYLVGSTQGLCISSVGYYVTTQGLYKIDPVTLGVNDHVRYNLYTMYPNNADQSSNNFYVDNNDNAYLLSSKASSITTERRQQLIRTDNLGDACGAEHLPAVDELFYSEIMHFDYESQRKQVVDHNPDIADLDLLTRDCEDYLPSQYRKLPVANTSTPANPVVYPTQLYSGDEQMYILLPEAYIDGSKVQIYSMDGRVIKTTDLMGNKRAKISLTLGTPAPGIYYVKVVNTTGAVFNQKVVVN